MLRNLRVLSLFFLIAALYSCQGNKVQEIPIVEFFKTPEKTNFKISPDGKYISYLKNYKLKQNLFIQSLVDGKERAATSFSDFAVRGDYSWTFDNQIVFSLDGTPHNVYLMFALDVNTLQKRPLLSEEKVNVRMVGRNKLTPDIITISMNKRDSANFDVYRLNVTNGELKPYLVNPGNITEWVMDADGRIRLAKASDGVDETILYRANDNAPFNPIIKNNFKNSVKPIAFTGVKNYFYALSNVGRDKTAFVEINAENGKEERVIYSSGTSDIQRVDYSKSKHRLELAAWEEAKPKKHFLNADIKTIYDNLSKQLGESEINITDRDTAEKKFIVTTYTDRSRGSVYLYERVTDKLIKLADNSDINPDELCTMQPIHYKASDGLIINGYLTLPLGDNKTNLPVVVMPHDGPFGARNSWEYKPEVQFLANRGFAVLQVNYRGSSGYGKAFYSAGFKEIGGKIQQDITDGVNWLIANKIANPKKIAIYGRGFGGFSALYGVSFHPHLYSCAVVQNGLISFFTYIQTAPAYYKPFLQKMYATIGDPEKDAAQLMAISPAFHPEKPVVPLFISQDAKDPRANLDDMNHYVSKLQKRNVQVKYSVNKNERGSVGNEKWRMQNYADIEKFLDNNIRVKP
ncbi:prolyl oligopeptidase family serine peptidase [Mucilaginibacter sp.]|uniref:alpha/beta hydrolase family protein n=1 Tax=Mucilaginibacter sp. TaxID=1882438 RepID=UPI002623CF28|nr:prolyl oligopeptidase family serine peptidase [Mucilaginibacter sp.]MDB4925675.1 family peptidase [Mucilaginibacter sp.]